MVTHNQTVTVSGSSSGTVAGIEFNNDGTKMFTAYAQPTGEWGDPHFIQEYNLSTPYDISTRVYTGDGERCELTGTAIANQYQVYDLEFSSDGMKFFTLQRKVSNDIDSDSVYGFDLTSPYDVSTCAFAKSEVDLDTTALTNGSNAGDYFGNNRDHRVQSLEINDDGTKLFLTFMDAANADVGARLYEYNLSTPYDVSTLSIVTTAGIELPPTINGATNPSGMRFSANGKRIFIISHNDNNAAIVQISLSKAYDTSSFTIDGGLNLKTGLSPGNDEPRGVAFSASGLKLYIGSDADQNSFDQIMEYDLVCPFTIIEGKCPAIAKGDRTGLAIAQIEVATRTIEQSTDTALNRLKWIRRNKDNQNLTNLNLDLNFTNPMLVSLAKVVKNSATRKKTKDQNQEQKQEQDIFFWSEGSIAIGRVGDTKVSSFKKIKTDAITVGADKFTKNNGIRGLAFRFGKDDVRLAQLEAI